MPPTHTAPHCLLQSWDTTTKEWIADPTPHESIAAATRAAIERGVYRVVVIRDGCTLEAEAFAIV